LQKGGADLQERLVAFGKLDADQVAFDHRQARPFEDFAALLRVAQEKADEAAFRRVGDRERDHADAATFEAADDFEKLTDAVSQKQRELADGRVVASPHSGEFGAGAFADTHELAAKL